MPSAAIDYSLNDIDTVTGRYVLGDDTAASGGDVLACRLKTISPTEFVATAPAVGSIGEVVRADFGPFGALHGRISRHVEDGFVVKLDGARAAQALLAERIEAFRRQPQSEEAADRRMGGRYLPAEPRSMLFAGPDIAVSCMIVDYSATGAVISAETRPAIGTAVTVGHMLAHVVRQYEFGFAVRFDNPHPDDDIETLLETPRAWRKAMAVLPTAAVDTADDSLSGHDGYGYD